MTNYYQDDQVTLHHGDALDVLKTMDSESVDCIVTSPPYFGLRDYGVDRQIGAEASPAEFVETLRAVFTEARRVMADDGTLWLNLGDSYDRKSKNLLGIPWRVAFALQDDGWILRSDIIWHKRTAMPESVKDRPTNAHEHLFLFAKSPRYYYDADAIAEPLSEVTVADIARRKTLNNKGTLGGVRADLGRSRSEYVRADGMRNSRDVWTIATQPFPGAHFATFPPELPERCIQAGCKPGGTVLDTFSGSGTTGMAAAKHGRRYVGIDLNHEYLDLSLRTRLQQPGLDLGSVS